MIKHNLLGSNKLQINIFQIVTVSTNRITDAEISFCSSLLLSVCPVCTNMSTMNLFTKAPARPHQIKLVSRMTLFSTLTVLNKTCLC